MLKPMRAAIGSIAAALALLATPMAAHAEQYWQCVPFARMVSGIQIFGDAWTWWGKAAGKYETGHTPKSGSVLVFRPQGAMKLGHVAMVNKVITDRIVQVTHANWSEINGARGQVEQDVTVIDVSPKGDWSEVKVWYDPGRDLGSTTYPTYGFIYQDQNAMRLAAAVRGVQTAMNSVASIGPNAVAASGQVIEQVSDGADRLAALIQQSLAGDSAAK